MMLLHRAVGKELCGSENNCTPRRQFRGVQCNALCNHHWLNKNALLLMSAHRMFS